MAHVGRGVRAGARFAVNRQAISVMHRTGEPPAQLDRGHVDETTLSSKWAAGQHKIIEAFLDAGVKASMQSAPTPSDAVLGEGAIAGNTLAHRQLWLGKNLNACEPWLLRTKSSCTRVMLG